jgi:hypothetical protein
VVLRSRKDRKQEARGRREKKRRGFNITDTQEEEEENITEN